MQSVASISLPEPRAASVPDRKEGGGGSFSSLLDAVTPESQDSPPPASNPAPAQDSPPPQSTEPRAGDERAAEPDANDPKISRKHRGHRAKGGKAEHKHAAKDLTKPAAQDAATDPAQSTPATDSTPAVTQAGIPAPAVTVTDAPKGETGDKAAADGDSAKAAAEMEIDAAAAATAGKPTAVVSPEAAAVPQTPEVPASAPKVAKPVTQAAPAANGNATPVAGDIDAAAKDTDAIADQGDVPAGADAPAPPKGAVGATADKPVLEPQKLAVADPGKPVDAASKDLPKDPLAPPAPMNGEAGKSTAEPAEVLKDVAKAAPDSRAPAIDRDAGAVRDASPPPTQPDSFPDSLRLFSSTLTPSSPQAQATGPSAPAVPPTAAAIAIEIAGRAKEGAHQFDIRLDPPELGRIDVRLDVGKGGEVSTRLTVDRPETLQLLQNDARGLERALQSAGLKTEDGSLQFSLRQQSPDGSQGQQAQTGPDSRAPVFVNDEEPASAGLEQYQWAARLRGGVDIRI